MCFPEAGKLYALHLFWTLQHHGDGQWVLCLLDTSASALGKLRSATNIISLDERFACIDGGLSSLGIFKRRSAALARYFGLVTELGDVALHVLHGRTTYRSAESIASPRKCAIGQHCSSALHACFSIADFPDTSPRHIRLSPFRKVCVLFPLATNASRDQIKRTTLERSQHE